MKENTGFYLWAIPQNQQLLSFISYLFFYLLSEKQDHFSGAWDSMYTDHEPQALAWEDLFTPFATLPVQETQGHQSTVSGLDTAAFSLP
jgi:hypothetical protein